MEQDTPVPEGVTRIALSRVRGEALRREIPRRRTGQETPRGAGRKFGGAAARILA